MLLHYKSNARRTRTTVTEVPPRGRRRVLGVIRSRRRTAVWSVVPETGSTEFVAARPLTAAALDSVAFTMVRG